MRRVYTQSKRKTSPFPCHSEHSSRILIFLRKGLTCRTPPDGIGVDLNHLKYMQELLFLPRRFCVVLAVLAVSALSAKAQTFSNPTPIIIPDSGAASPYPSNIVVSGVGTVTGLTVSLFNMNHTFPADLDILLVGPLGFLNVLLMSDAGGGFDIVGVNLTFMDGAPVLPTSQITSGTYSPTNYGTGDTFPAPAPAPPYGATLSVFNGTNGNGTWSLYVFDDAGGDSGTIAEGWSLTIVPEPSTFALFGGGALVLALAARKRRTRSS